MPNDVPELKEFPALWAEMDPRLSVRDPRLLELRRYWDEIRGDRPMPRRADIRPEDIRTLLPNIVLIDVQPEPLRLRYRLIGTEITRTMQRDSTGKYYDEIYSPDLLAEIYRTFRQVIARKAPLRTFGTAFYPDKNYYSYETLNLPLSEDGTTINMVLGMLVFHLGAPA
ncbi:PAS domain-containing protein [Desertibaculum subflavum]|uniref:PAS domain-containing protein n=1 Tax=Desertibaculum subflavum TaxID=2268458 RepID=UPI000E6739A9